MKGNMYYQDLEGQYHYDNIYTEDGHVSVDQMRKLQKQGFMVWIEWFETDANNRWYKYLPNGGSGDRLKDADVPKELKALRMLYADKS